MSPAVRKLALIVHLVLSMGWIGAVLAYIALDVAAVSTDHETMRMAWAGMALVGSWVIVPLAIGSLITGLMMSLGTPWGLFRHYWVLISLVLTIFATAVLLEHMSSVQAIADAMQAMGVSATQGSRGGDFMHSIGGLVVLLLVAVLNVYKPRGLTPYGWRRQLVSASKTAEG
jgi:hypothetical protein